jgi:hypothetical protein
MSTLSDTASIAQPRTSVVAMRMAGKSPPAIEIDRRFRRAFPEQAENLEQFSNDLAAWWRQVAVESQRETS